MAAPRTTRITTRPDPPAPQLLCPQCVRPLVYRQTITSGVGVLGEDRWDHFACRSCGAFEYRHRTRRLRPLEAAS